MYEEKSYSEPEEEENEYITEGAAEEIEETAKRKKTVSQKRKNNIFEYLNNDAKRNKR